MDFAGKSCLADSVIIPLFKELIPDGIEYGKMLLAEFEPDSIWYEASLTVAAQALRNSVKTDYHAFRHIPSEVSGAVARFGLNVTKLQADGFLTIIDSYTVQTGLGIAEKTKDADAFKTQSIRLSDWSIGTAQTIKKGTPELERKRLHIDDDTSILLQYNDEKVFIDHWRTRVLPEARSRELAFLHSAVVGVHSDAFYRQFESSADGIIEFKRQEKARQIKYLVRVKAMHGRRYDPQWHKLTLGENFEVTLEK